MFIITMIIHEHLSVCVESCVLAISQLYCWICSNSTSICPNKMVIKIKVEYMYEKLYSLSRFHRWLLADECALPGRC